MEEQRRSAVARHEARRGGEEGQRLRRDGHQRTRHRDARHALQHDALVRRRRRRSCNAIASSCRRSPSAPSGASATAAICEILQTPLGRLGGLICWEHQMTLAKYALYAQGEQVHCAPVAGVHSAERADRLRHAPVRVRGRLLRRLGLRHRAERRACAEGAGRDHAVEANGGSAIIGPNGGYLAGPIYGKEEILYAEIDIEQAIREKHSRDVAGHYARPDVLQLVVNMKPKAGRRHSSTDSAAAEPHGSARRQKRWSTASRPCASTSAASSTTSSRTATRRQRSDRRGAGVDRTRGRRRLEPRVAIAASKPRHPSPAYTQDARDSDAQTRTAVRRRCGAPYTCARRSGDARHREVRRTAGH